MAEEIIATSPLGLDLKKPYCEGGKSSVCARMVARWFSGLERLKKSEIKVAFCENDYICLDQILMWMRLMEGDWRNRIIVDPKILVGKPVIKGTRLAVEFVLELLANGWTVEDILKNYPQLKKEDITAVLEYAAEV